VLINVSPIEYGHVLLVPRVNDRLPQALTPDTLLLALNMASEAANPYFRVGFNSLGAYATINHLHFQAYYLHAPFPVERVPTVKVQATKNRHLGVSLSRLAEFPVRGLAYEMGEGTLAALAEAVGRCCEELSRRNIPFNVLICDRGARVFLFPQCYAERQAKGEVAAEYLETGVNPAVFEIAGHVVLKADRDYEAITQLKAWDILAQVSLSEARFLEVEEVAVAQLFAAADD
jgi:GDP-L-galactose phosphorylase